MTSTVLGLVLALTAHIYWASENFSLASDAKDIKRDVSEMRILELRQNQCKLRNEKNPSNEARIWVAQQLNEQLQRYREATGKSYNLPACELITQVRRNSK